MATGEDAMGGGYVSLIDGAASGTFSEAQGVTIMRQMSRDEMVWPAR